MRAPPIALLGLAVALALTLRVQARTDVPPGVVAGTAEPSGPAAEPAPPPPGPAPVEPVASVEARVAAAPEAPGVQPPSEPRRPTPVARPGRRSRNFNRYPGPIPTPEEWVPPDGPVRIALQAGHWRADEAPDELAGLRDNGTRWGRTAEWEVNLEIARTAGTLLEELGYEVDILPAVVPPDYRAHLFISIHADGSADANASGYRVAAPRRDATGRAEAAAALLLDSYGRATGLRKLPDVTRRMQNYYAFNYRRYEHALHPMTIAVILETGFLTSARDRDVILSDPERAARGIVEAVTEFPVTRLATAMGGG